MSKQHSARTDEWPFFCLCQRLSPDTCHTDQPRLGTSKISAIYNSTPVKSNGARSTCDASRALNSVALLTARRLRRVAQSCQVRFTAPHGTVSPFLPVRHTAHAHERHSNWAVSSYGCALVSVSASPPQSISASAQSWSLLYRAWSSGSLTRSLLRGCCADSQTVKQYLSQAPASSYPCSLRTISSACTVFSSESKLPSHGTDHQVHASPHVASVKTTAGADASTGYVASPSRVAPFVQSTSSSSLLFLSPPSPFLVSPGRSRSCRRRMRPLASLRQRGNDGGKAVASGSGIAVASGRVRLRLLCNLFVGRPFF